MFHAWNNCKQYKLCICEVCSTKPSWTTYLSKALLNWSEALMWTQKYTAINCNQNFVFGIHFIFFNFHISISIISHTGHYGIKPTTDGDGYFSAQIYDQANWCMLIPEGVKAFLWATRAIWSKMHLAQIGSVVISRLTHWAHKLTKIFLEISFVLLTEI